MLVRRGGKVVHFFIVIPCFIFLWMPEKKNVIGFLLLFLLVLFTCRLYKIITFLLLREREEKMENYDTHSLVLPLVISIRRKTFQINFLTFLFFNI